MGAMLVTNLAHRGILGFPCDVAKQEGDVAMRHHIQDVHSDGSRFPALVERVTNMGRNLLADL